MSEVVSSSDFQSKVKSVRKLTNNVNGTDKNAAVTATSDKLFLLSYSEIVPTSYWASSYPWTSSEGTQYEAFKGKVTNNHAENDCLAIISDKRRGHPFGQHQRQSVAQRQSAAIELRPPGFLFLIVRYVDSALMLSSGRAESY